MINTVVTLNIGAVFNRFEPRGHGRPNQGYYRCSRR